MAPERQLPEVIREVGFDFHWDERKVWRLKLSKETLPIEELTWHFDVPFLWSKPDGFYDLKPRDVINNPEHYPDEYERAMKSDATFPIDIMSWKGRQVILDGLHRLMKAEVEGRQTVEVRKVPESAIPLISI